MPNAYMIRNSMGKTDDILESKMLGAEKSDFDEGCLMLNAYLVGVLWLAIS